MGEWFVYNSSNDPFKYLYHSGFVSKNLFDISFEFYFLAIIGFVGRWNIFFSNRIIMNYIIDLKKKKK